jgi:pimeloyl-ACP methyl ester carboxylesterase
MRVKANGLSIEVDDAGPRNAPALLLVMGLGMQLTAWPQELVALLVARGFRVIRFDNRDIGLSDGFDHAGVPNVALGALRHSLGLPLQSPYSLRDMADDALGVLDALGIVRAHVCGASLGGMIAQHLAAAHPERVESLTLMMTTSGSRRLPGPTLRARVALLSRPRGASLEARIDHSVRVFTTIGSPAFRPDPAWFRQRVAASFERAWRPNGSPRQLLAIAADGDRTPLLGRIAAPTQVIHGMHDPLIPVASGRDLVARIPGAVGDFIDGMGHDLPLVLLPRFADRIAGNAARAEREVAGEQPRALRAS